MVGEHPIDTTRGALKDTFLLKSRSGLHLFRVKGKVTYARLEDTRSRWGGSYEKRIRKGIFIRRTVDWYELTARSRIVHLYRCGFRRRTSSQTRACATRQGSSVFL